GRKEAVITQLALMGAPKELCEQVYGCVTTDSAAEFIHAAGYDAVWDRIALAARDYMRFRVREEIAIDVLVTDYTGNVMGKSLAESEG
ncbi:MAG: hypothetical protein J6Z38_05920, partial [Lachnospiraceae bacterium]|nr:hypothetical protein [Lachnospiraceae bacterium]